jgi:hypothetical protein
VQCSAVQCSAVQCSSKSDVCIWYISVFQVCVFDSYRWMFLYLYLPWGVHSHRHCSYFSLLIALMKAIRIDTSECGTTGTSNIVVVRSIVLIIMDIPSFTTFEQLMMQEVGDGSCVEPNHDCEDDLRHPTGTSTLTLNHHTGTGTSIPASAANNVTLMAESSKQQHYCAPPTRRTQESQHQQHHLTAVHEDPQSHHETSITHLLHHHQQQQMQPTPTALLPNTDEAEDDMLHSQHDRPLSSASFGDGCGGGSSSSDYDVVMSVINNNAHHHTNILNHDHHPNAMDQNHLNSISLIYSLENLQVPQQHHKQQQQQQQQFNPPYHVSSNHNVNLHDEDNDDLSSTMPLPRICRICHKMDHRPVLRFAPVEYDMNVVAVAPHVQTFPLDICLHVFCGKTASILPHINQPEYEILTKAGIKNKHGIGGEVNAALSRTRCAVTVPPTTNTSRGSLTSTIGNGKEKQFYLVREFEAHLSAVRGYINQNNAPPPPLPPQAMIVHPQPSNPYQPTVSSITIMVPPPLQRPQQQLAPQLQGNGLDSSACRNDNNDNGNSSHSTMNIPPVTSSNSYNERQLSPSSSSVKTATQQQKLPPTSSTSFPLATESAPTTNVSSNSNMDDNRHVSTMSHSLLQSWNHAGSFNTQSMGNNNNSFNNSHHLMTSAMNGNASTGAFMNTPSGHSSQPHPSFTQQQPQPSSTMMPNFQLNYINNNINGNQNVTNALDQLYANIIGSNDMSNIGYTNSATGSSSCSNNNGNSNGSPTLEQLESLLAQQQQQQQQQQQSGTATSALLGGNHHYTVPSTTTSCHKKVVPAKAGNVLSKYQSPQSTAGGTSVGSINNNNNSTGHIDHDHDPTNYDPNQKIRCECGGVHLHPFLTSRGMASYRNHEKTKRHQKYLSDREQLANAMNDDHGYAQQIAYSSSNYDDTMNNNSNSANNQLLLPYTTTAQQSQQQSSDMSSSGHNPLHNFMEQQSHPTTDTNGDNSSCNSSVAV